MVFGSAVILSSILEPPALSISTTIPEGSGTLPDFTAFSVVNTMICLTSGGGPSTAEASSRIVPYPGNSILSTCLQWCKALSFSASESFTSFGSFTNFSPTMSWLSPFNLPESWKIEFLLSFMCKLLRFCICAFLNKADNWRGSTFSSTAFLFTFTLLPCFL